MPSIQSFRGVKISDTLTSLLASSWSGRVIGVYDSSINIEVDKEILNIGRSRMPVAPHSIRAEISDDYNFSENLKNDMTVNFEKICIEIPDACFACELNNAERCPSTMAVDKKYLGIDKIKANLSMLEDILNENASEKGACIYIKELKGFLFENRMIYAGTPFSSNFFFRLKELIDSAAENDADGICSALKGFIGAGIGLTPSADDIVLGITAWFSYFSNRSRENWFNAIAEFLSEDGESATTRVSIASLKFAANGKFSETVNNLLYAVLISGEQKNIYDEALSLLSHGHSSGAETSMGLLVGASIDSIRF